MRPGLSCEWPSKNYAGSGRQTRVVGNVAFKIEWMRVIYGHFGCSSGALRLAYLWDVCIDINVHSVSPSVGKEESVNVPVGGGNSGMHYATSRD